MQNIMLHKRALLKEKSKDEDDHRSHKLRVKSPMNKIHVRLTQEKLT